MVLLGQIDRDKIPQHVAVIMDGNGRWAKEKGKMRVFGHKNGVSAVRDIVEGASQLGIKYLTLYTFSTENWNRPKFEVSALMDLMVSTMSSEIQKLKDNQIRLNAIGNLESLPPKVYKQLQESIAATKNNTGLVLTLALSYSARWEITNATKQIAQKVARGEMQANEITEESIANHLTTSHMPNPELMIRTGGETRISNYLLWQLAYAELYFTSKLWPDFSKEDLFQAVGDYQKRERRFGLISEQLN